ncbi:ABC transporter ATP-binding protein [candidate division KSB1 bacterium]
MKISIKGLSKRYNHGVQALRDVNMEIESGIFGLLGPNGAGKTTLMRILVTLIEPTEGEVKIDKYDIRKHRKEIRSILGYLPQNFSTFSRLSAWEFLEYSALLAGVKNTKDRKNRIEKMLEIVGLYEVRDRRANKLSGGMKRRLGIAQALIGDPKILIIDEPTTGLDPEERLRFRNLMTVMSRKDIIIILSTHIVGDISSSCSQMAMLNKGSLVYNDSPAKLIDETRGHVWLVNADDFQLVSLKEKYPVISTVRGYSGWEVQVVADDLKDYKGTPVEPNLEHAYVHFLEHKLGEQWSKDDFWK